MRSRRLLRLQLFVILLIMLGTVPEEVKGVKCYKCDEGDGKSCTSAKQAQEDCPEFCVVVHDPDSSDGAFRACADASDEKCFGATDCYNDDLKTKLRSDANCGKMTLYSKVATLLGSKVQVCLCNDKDLCNDKGGPKINVPVTCLSCSGKDSCKSPSEVNCDSGRCIEGAIRDTVYRGCVSEDNMGCAGSPGQTKTGRDAEKAWECAIGGDSVWQKPSGWGLLTAAGEGESRTCDADKCNDKLKAGSGGPGVPPIGPIGPGPGPSPVGPGPGPSPVGPGPDPGPTGPGTGKGKTIKCYKCSAGEGSEDKEKEKNGEATCKTKADPDSTCEGEYCYSNIADTTFGARRCLSKKEAECFMKNKKQTELVMCVKETADVSWDSTVSDLKNDFKCAGEGRGVEVPGAGSIGTSTSVGKITTTKCICNKAFCNNPTAVGQTAKGVKEVVEVGKTKSGTERVTSRSSFLPFLAVVLVGGALSKNLYLWGLN